MLSYMVVIDNMLWFSVTATMLQGLAGDSKTFHLIRASTLICVLLIFIKYNAFK